MIEPEHSVLIFRFALLVQTGLCIFVAMLQ